MGITRKATAHWAGDLKSGKGTISTPQSGLLASGLLGGLGLSDGGHAGQVHRGQHGPNDEGACAFGHGCLRSIN